MLLVLFSDSLWKLRQLLGRCDEPIGQVQWRVHSGSPPTPRLEVVQPNSSSPSSDRQAPRDIADDQGVVQLAENEVRP